MSSKKRINRDHAKKKNRPQVENEAVANHLEDLLIPAMAAQKTFYRQLNLRDRILTLSCCAARLYNMKIVKASNRQIYASKKPPLSRQKRKIN